MPNALHFFVATHKNTEEALDREERERDKVLANNHNWVQ